jgi:hypothetical protein
LIGAWIEDLAWPEVGAKFATRDPTLATAAKRRAILAAAIADLAAGLRALCPVVSA